MESDLNRFCPTQTSDRLKETQTLESRALMVSVTDQLMKVSDPFVLSDMIQKQM